MNRQTSVDRQAEREKQNILLRAYGYHWKRFENLTQDQESYWFHHLCGIDDERPAWILLSPLEMPVKDFTIFRWLADRGASSEDVIAFLSEHGFVALGKDERHVWRIQASSGDVLNLKQALQKLERIRIDQAKAREHAEKQKLQEDFANSAASLKEVLDRYGSAQNDAHAWGYSPFPHAKRLSDGPIEVTTYHFEGEWNTTVCKTEAEVIAHLFSDADGYWTPGEWEKA